METTLKLDKIGHKNRQKIFQKIQEYPESGKNTLNQDKNQKNYK